MFFLQSDQYQSGECGSLQVYFPSLAGRVTGSTKMAPGKDDWETMTGTTMVKKQDPLYSIFNSTGL